MNYWVVKNKMGGFLTSEQIDKLEEESKHDEEFKKYLEEEQLNEDYENWKNESGSKE